jgi:hypothetical protein
VLPGEWQRVTRCLEQLAPHVDARTVALTGGVALALMSDDVRERITDIDFVARHMTAIEATVTRDFLVSHYHVAQPGVPKAIVQLVDPDTRLRVEFFPDLAGVIERARPAPGIPFAVLGAPDLLDHKLQLLRKPVDEKHWRDAVFLAARGGVAPPSRPASCVTDDYCQDLAHHCERCALSQSPSFPLAPKAAIFDILGYV